MGRLLDETMLRRDTEKSMRNNPHKDASVIINHDLEHRHFLHLISLQPTVDAVEVVRCGKCKKKRAEHGYLWCYKWDDEVQEHDFCSYGEKEK